MPSWRPAGRPWPSRRRDRRATCPGFRLNRRAEAPAGFEVGLIADDVPAAFAPAVAAGAEPVTKPWGQIVAYVRGRDGVLVELGSAMVG